MHNITMHVKHKCTEIYIQVYKELLSTSMQRAAESCIAVSVCILVWIAAMEEHKCMNTVCE